MPQAELHVSLDYPTSYQTIRLIKQMPSYSFFDLVATPEKENAADILRKSFSAAVKRVETWKGTHTGEPTWGAFKDSYVGHLLRLDPLSRHVIQGGNNETVNALTRTHGPSWRMVISLEKPGVKAWAVYPGGQSGNPGSPFYDNMVDKWSNGKYFGLRFTRTPDQLSTGTLFTIQLNPAQ